MDPLSAILFFIIGVCLVSLWSKIATNSSNIAALKSQMGRFISDIESEKETRRRANSTFNNRLRMLEGLKPISNDDPEAPR